MYAELPELVLELPPVPHLAQRIPQVRQQSPRARGAQRAAGPLHQEDEREEGHARGEDGGGGLGGRKRAAGGQPTRRQRRGERAHDEGEEDGSEQRVGGLPFLDEDGHRGQECVWERERERAESMLETARPRCESQRESERRGPAAGLSQASEVCQRASRATRVRN